MKKLLITAAVAASALGLAGCQAPTTAHLETPDAAYEIDTWGSNSEVYEFTPQTAPSKTCVMLMLDSGMSMSMECFDKQ